MILMMLSARGSRRVCVAALFYSLSPSPLAEESKVRRGVAREEDIEEKHKKEKGKRNPRHSDAKRVDEITVSELKKERQKRPDIGSTMLPEDDMIRVFTGAFRELHEAITQRRYGMWWVFY